MEDKEDKERNITSKYDYLSEDNIKKILLDESYNFDILSLNVHSCLNIGNMIRTSNLTGCRKFIIFGRRKYDKRSAVGAQHYMTIERVSGLKNEKTDTTIQLEKEDYDFDEKIFAEFVQQNNYIPVFIEQDSKSVPATNENISNIIKHSTEIKKTVLIIFGNESTGIPENILETRQILSESYTLELQQKGCINSFNVSNCCAIVSYKFMECFKIMECLKFME